MDAQTKRAVLVACAMICSEKTQKIIKETKKVSSKRRRKRIWVKEWIGASGQYGLSALHRELEMHDKGGFMELLRMSAEEFDLLLGMVEHLIVKQDTQMRRAITPRERLSLTLRFLATGETFKTLTFQYRIGTSTISQIVMETCAALYRAMKKDFLKTPSTQAEWRTIARDFEAKRQFPHCLGALGGKHIHIQPPAKSGSVYRDYKDRFSVMAAVDANYKFIYASVGVQGRLADAGPFAHSDLCKAMDRGLLNFPPPEPLPNSDIMMPYMFLGDEAYPLRHDLITPYPFRQMDHHQRVLNYRLSRGRRVAESAFGVLANRLRVFGSTIYLEPDKVAKITMASLCIYNFLCECSSEAYTPPAFADWENADHNIVDGAWRNEGTGVLQPLGNGRACNATLPAEMQRDLLCDYFVSPAGSVPWQEEHI